MKPISVHAGSPQEKIVEERAWWPTRSTSGKRIWPGQKYILIKRYYDDMGRPPIKGLSWDYIYTKHEYLVELLKKK